MVDPQILSSILTAFDYDQDGVLSAGDLQVLFSTFNIDATSDDCDMLLENLLDFTHWAGDTSFRSGLTGLSIDGLERVLRAAQNVSGNETVDIFLQTEVEVRSEQWVLKFLKDNGELATAESIHSLAQALRIPMSEADAVSCIRMWGALISNESYCIDKIKTFGAVPHPPLELIGTEGMQTPKLTDQELRIILSTIKRRPQNN